VSAWLARAPLIMQNRTGAAPSTGVSPLRFCMIND
jgi:hypothetical protein